jgi:phosphopentomutase
VTAGRAFVVTLDACGVGELPDSADYGDAGAATLPHLAEAVGGLRLPTLEALGLGAIVPMRGLSPHTASAIHGRLAPAGPGKDSTTGHWELMGRPAPGMPPTYPDGFPEDVLARLRDRTGREFCCNRPYDGIGAIEDFGEHHLRTGELILYTSQDSVLQVAAHTDVLSEADLRETCRVIRGEMTGEHAVGRVIARPFLGEPGNYVRTANRHDFSLEPRRPNYLSLVRDAGSRVYGVGKINDIFAGCDIDESFPTKSNVEGIQRIEELLREIDGGLVFANLVETDMLWGHRNDPENFHRCLQDFDRRLPDLLEALRDGDLLILTSDHGCDPTTPSTDHSREHALLLAYAAGRNANGATHEGEFADVGATVNAWLGGKAPSRGIPGAPILTP